MNRIKIAAVFLIIGVGVVGAYLISQNPITKNESTTNSSDSKSDVLSDINPIKWVENLVSPDTDSKIFNKENKIKSDNLTNLFAASMFNKMKEADQSGNNPFNSVDYLNNSDMQKMFQDSLNNSNQFFSEGLDDKYAKISGNNSKEAKIKYLREIEQISNNRLSNQELLIKSSEQLKSDINNDCFLQKENSANARRAQLDRDLFSDYSALEVPSDWLSFHKRLLTHVQKAETIFSSLSKCADDPVKASVVAMQLPNLINDSAEVDILLSGKYREVGL